MCADNWLIPADAGASGSRAAVQAVKKQLEKMSLVEEEQLGHDAEETGAHSGGGGLALLGGENGGGLGPEEEAALSGGVEQYGELPPHESMYVSALDHLDTEPAERRDSRDRARFCCDGIEEEDEDDAAWEGPLDPQWTWISAGGCSLDPDRLPAHWFVDTSRPEPEVGTVPVLHSAIILINSMIC